VQIFKLTKQQSSPCDPLPKGNWTTQLPWCQKVDNSLKGVVVLVVVVVWGWQ